MKRIRYSKYVPDPASEMSMEDLLSALSDYLLQSGFQDSMWYEMPEGEHTLEALRRAIEEALVNGEMFDESLRERIEQMMAEGKLDELIEKLIERMQQEDYISIDRPYEDQPHDPARQSSVGGQTGEAQKQSSKSPTKASIFSASSRCAICSGRSANPALDATIRATLRPALRPAARPKPTNSATR